MLRARVRACVRAPVTECVPAARLLCPRVLRVRIAAAAVARCRRSSVVRPYVTAAIARSLARCYSPVRFSRPRAQRYTASAVRTRPDPTHPTAEPKVSSHAVDVAGQTTRTPLLLPDTRRDSPRRPFPLKTPLAGRPSDPSASVSKYTDSPPLPFCARDPLRIRRPPPLRAAIPARRENRVRPTRTRSSFPADRRL